MNPMPDLVPMLKQLRLSGILDSLDSRNKQAIDKKMAYPDFLALLISDEVARREQKRFATRCYFPNSSRLISDIFSQIIVMICCVVCDGYLVELICHNEGYRLLGRVKP